MEQTKTEFYQLLNQSVAALTGAEENILANLCNAAALMGQMLPQINWAGFYLMDGGTLLLGPFWGKPACIRIQPGRGVCGTAAATDTVQRIADVHEFPGHIACDAASASEIVIPIHADGRVVAVLDIDSPVRDRFDEDDEAGLRELSAILERRPWNRSGYDLR